MCTRLIKYINLDFPSPISTQRYETKFNIGAKSEISTNKYYGISITYYPSSKIFSYKTKHLQFATPHIATDYAYRLMKREICLKCRNPNKCINNSD